MKKMTPSGVNGPSTMFKIPENDFPFVLADEFALLDWSFKGPNIFKKNNGGSFDGYNQFLQSGVRQILIHKIDKIYAEAEYIAPGL